MDFHLKPLAQQVKSFVKDTNDFLRKISALPEVDENVLLCTVDVVGLYPSIPHVDGLEALRLALNGRDDQSISTESLVELAQCVLENNVFEHDGNIYRQKQGTAIGTKMAPNYAILFMAALEEKFLDSSPLKPKLWLRYIDDIFFLWEHGEEALKIFLQQLNEAHPTVKFTADYSYDSINFLDVKVSRNGKRLVTDLYVKPTDTHQYLDASSCHPVHCKTSIPYSQALRLNRICSEPSSFDLRCNELEAWLIERGYDERLVRSKVLAARKHKRMVLLQREKGEKSFKLTFNIVFHPAFQDLGKLLRKLHVILACDKEHHNVFKDIPIVGFRKGKSLQDYLVRAKVQSLEPQSGACTGCSSKRCEVELSRGSTFADKKGNIYHNRSGILNCNSQNIVYLITCRACGLQYVGSTKNKFRERYNNYHSAHRNLLKGKKVNQKQLHEHFESPGHSGWSDFNFTLIDQGVSESDARIRERFWQYKLETFLPEDGLNDREVDMDEETLNAF